MPTFSLGPQNSVKRIRGCDAPTEWICSSYGIFPPNCNHPDNGNGATAVHHGFPAYQSPAQFKQFNQFLIDNTDQAYLFYEPENETNLKYFYNMIIAASDYPLFRLTFDDLNEVMSE